MPWRTPREQVLDAIESALRASEPHLSAMFAMFCRLTAGEEAGGTEHLTLRRPAERRLRAMLLVVFPVLAVMILTAGLVIGLTTSGASACGAAAHASAVTSRYGCQLPHGAP